MGIESMILAELSGGDYASGEAISRKLNVSRAAVWKHVDNLRRHGYEIDASPRRGYRLAGRPDKLLAGELKPSLETQIIGKSIIHYEEVTSTADAARELAESGAPEGAVVVAESQTAGRGRLGRKWLTTPGTSIALSVVLYPPLPPAQAPLLSLAAGLAVATAVMATTGKEAGLKWPNDIYLGGRKVGGVLMEMAAELDRVKWVTAGIGLNVSSDSSGTELKDSATSLAAETGSEVSRLNAAAALLSEFDRLYGLVLAGEMALISEGFRRLDMLNGQDIEVSDGDVVVSGAASGIDDSGRLLVRSPGGEIIAFAGGEATLRRQGNT